MKLCMSRCSHKSIPDARFEADISSNFGDITSQNFPVKEAAVNLSNIVHSTTRTKSGEATPRSAHESFDVRPGN